MRNVRRAAAERLRAAGVASPDWDADLLLAHVLDIPVGQLALVEAITPAQIEQYDALVARRATREPLQHLTGFAGFRHVELAVGPGVFVPRPETESLAGWAIERALELEAPVVVELCAGLVQPFQLGDLVVQLLDRPELLIDDLQRVADLDIGLPALLLHADGGLIELAREIDGLGDDLRAQGRIFRRRGNGLDRLAEAIERGGDGAVRAGRAEQGLEPLVVRALHLQVAHVALDDPPGTA